MFYSIKNIAQTAKKQRLLSLLLVLNIIISCFVMCFSYGLYQNYNVVISDGEQEENRLLPANADKKFFTETKYGFHTSGITVGMVKGFLRSLSPETAANLKSLTCENILENDFYCFQGENIGISYFVFELRAENGKVAPSKRLSQVFSQEEFMSGERIVKVGPTAYDPKRGFSMGFMLPNGKTWQSNSRILKEDDEYITVNGMKYRIEVLPKELVKPGMYEYQEDEIDIVHQIFIPFGTLPDDIEFVLEGETSPFFFEFYEPITKSQYNDIAACLEAYTAGRATLPPMEFTEVSEIYYYRTILLISAVIAVLAAVNMAILYKYILERRARTIVIFRICGSSLLRMCGMYICECMLIVIPLFALTELFYHTVIMPKLSTVFEYMESAYSLNIYLYIFVIYIAISFVVLLGMILFTLRKQNLIDQKAKTVSHRSAVMKVFEICQLGAVLVLCIMISSVIVSRYRLYEPFKDMLGGKGFIAYNAGGGGTTPDDLAKEFSDAEILNTCVGGYYIEAEEKEIDALTYCDKLVDIYTPELSEGIWLNESTDSYEKTGIMPAVADAKCKYQIGEIITVPDYENAWDENGQPISKADVKIKIIGRLKDNAAIVSYPDHIKAPKNCKEIYGTLHSDFEDNDYLLMRIEDMHAFTGRHTPVVGNQFIICDGLDEAVIKDYEDKLSKLAGFSYESFEAVNSGSKDYIYEQMTTIFPIALCIFILTAISSISISAINTKRSLRRYAVFYICGARWRSCALISLRKGLITSLISAALAAVFLTVGKQTFMKETVIRFAFVPILVCSAVIAVYTALVMIMPLLIIGRTAPREVLKEE